MEREQNDKTEEREQNDLAELVLERNGTVKKKLENALPYCWVGSALWEKPDNSG